MANEIEKRNEAFLIYQDENGIARVNVRFEGEDVWLLQEQIMELFDASRQDVSYHINQIYAEGEQDLERTRKIFLIVRQEGNRSVKRNMFLLHENKNATYDEIAKRLDIERTTVWRNIDAMKKKAVLRRVGEDKNGYWEVLLDMVSH